jgi:putative ABC transport system permease protein
MKTRDVFSYSFSAIKLRKLRAGLTTLGVIIGIAAIVALLSITQGLQTTITGQLEKGLATDTLIVTPSSGGLGGGGGFGGGGFGGGGGASSSGFKLYISNATDINNNKNVSSYIVTSFAVIQRAGYIQSGDRVRQVSITGINFFQYSQVYSSTFVASSGSIPLNPSENETVVGTRVSDPRQNGTLFLKVNDDITMLWTNATTLPPVNETYPAHVVGVLQKIGGFGVGGSPTDSGVYIPISQAQNFFGTNECDMIVVKLENSDNATITAVSNEITREFNNQVTVVSSSYVLSLLSSIFSIIQLFLAGIAAISLLVAGIGIMNIMIVSLIERTREIGILKALGMKSRTVLSIFLCESVIIGLIGAVVGILLGWGLANVVAVLFSGGGPFQGIGGNQAATSVGGGGMTITPVLSPIVFIGALAFGIGVSVIFALYPAWRASKLKPVEALRYE